MAGPVVVDSDMLIDYFGGHAPSADAVEALIDADRLVLTSVTLFELASGAQTESQRADLATLIRAAQTVPLDVTAAMEAGRLYRGLRSTGDLLDTSDLLIAACCLSRGYPLLTRNWRHFGRIEGLPLLRAQQIREERGSESTGDAE